MESRKVIIAGSRKINVSKQFLYDVMWEAGYHYTPEFAEKYGKNHISEVVCGLAKGIDQCGQYFGISYSIPVVYFEADWDTYGRAAGPIRNKQMGEYGDDLVLIWDGKSTGSASMKSIMLGLGKPVYEAVFKGWS